MRLRKAVDVLKTRIKNLENVVIDADRSSDGVDLQVAHSELKTARAKLQKTELLVHRKDLVLGVSSRKALAQLAKSPYITARMNARALKYRAREKLRNRKFELDRVERNYHRKKTGTRSFL